MEELGKRLRELRKVNGWSAVDLEREWNIPKDRIYKWEKGTKPTDPRDYLGLLAFLKSGKLEDFTKSYSGEGAAYQPSGYQSETNDLTDATEGVPVYDISFSAGMAFSMIESRADGQIIGRLDAPQVSGCDAIIRARGDSMADFIQPGDWLGIKQIKDMELILWDYPYAITTEDLELVKYIKKGSTPDELILSSHNKNYSDVILPRQKIMQLFIVKVVLPFSMVKTLF